jgi:3-oxoacyl-[acyl-carrier-protein] synthase I
MSDPDAPLVTLLTAGLVSPLGLDRAATCAAVRAQLSSFRESRFVSGSGDTIVGGYIDALGLEVGGSRLVQLAAAALLPVLEQLEGHVALESIPLYLGLPEPRPGIDANDDILGLLAVQAGLGKAPRWRAIYEGNGSALLALERGVEQILRAEAELCIVGAVDSYWQEETLDWLDAQRRLISDTSLDGLVPGEGAAFILVGSQAAVRHLDLHPEALLVSIANDSEPHDRTTEGICIGQGLTSVLRRVLTEADRRRARPDWVVCDMNGETFRGNEWVYAYIRTGKLHRDPLEIWHPADSWGDVGAASGAMLLANAMHALAEGYGRGPGALVWVASDGPSRGAAVLRADQGKATW